MNQRLSVRIVTVALAVAFGGTAMAQLPGGAHSGSGAGAGQSSGALVTLAIPSIVGVNVAHNFVLDFNSSTKCWGTSSVMGSGGAVGFPQSPSGATTYTFAVDSVSHADSSTPVACTLAGAQPDVATVQVFSTAASSTLKAGIVDGGQGGAATTFSNLIGDIFSANRLTLSTTDTCGGVGAAPVSPMNLGTVAGNLVTTIPKTGWADCKQKLTLTLAAATPVSAGTATGTLTFTITAP